MAYFLNSAWQDLLPRLSPPERQQHVRDLARGIHRITDDDGKPLSFDAGPTTCTTAPRVELKRDNSGRVVVKPVETVNPQVEARGEINMDRFRSQMKLAETFKDEDKQKAIKAIYLEHLGVEI